MVTDMSKCRNMLPRILSAFLMIYLTGKGRYNELVCDPAASSAQSRMPCAVESVNATLVSFRRCLCYYPEDHISKRLYWKPDSEQL